ncbi:MAG: flippase-like domain-containing protein [Deltaproteobacteria bacterium]|nr:flippase-like domain-containing protein [Deltaproteobacteria bacterium]
MKSTKQNSKNVSSLWRKIQKRWRWLLGVLGLVMAWYALRGVAWDEVLKLFSGIDTLAILSIVAINLLMLPVMTARWWLLLKTLGTPVSLLSVCAYRTAANAISYLTPGPHFGGEPLSVYLLHQRQKISVSAATASVAVDRLLELLASFVVLALCLVNLAFAEINPFYRGQQLSIVIGTLALFSLILLALFTGKRPFSRSVLLISRLYGKYVNQISSRTGSFMDTLVTSESMAEALFYSHRYQFILINLLSLSHWIAIFAEFWLMSFFLGVSLSFWQMTAVVVVARLAFFTPFPAGIGVLESALPWLTASLGLGSGLGLGLLIIIRLRDLLFSLAGLGLTTKYLTCQRKVSIIDDMQ